MLHIQCKHRVKLFNVATPAKQNGKNVHKFMIVLFVCLVFARFHSCAHIVNPTHSNSPEVP